MLLCIIGDFYINKYATCWVFYVQEWNISQEAFLFCVVYLSLHQSFAQSFELFNGRIEEGTYCPLRNIIFVMLYLWVKRRRFLEGYFSSVGSLQNNFINHLAPIRFHINIPLCSILRVFHFFLDMEQIDSIAEHFGIKRYRSIVAVCAIYPDAQTGDSFVFDTDIVLCKYSHSSL